MTRRPRLLGHPLHPITVHVPLGLLLAGTAFDLLALTVAGPWPDRAQAVLAAGLIASVPTLATGFVELVAIPPRARHARLATLHLVCASAALASYLASLALRWDEPSPPSAATLLTSLAGAALLGVTGWLGAELVYGYGEGVRAPQTHLEDPS